MRGQNAGKKKSVLAQGANPLFTPPQEIRFTRGEHSFRWCSPREFGISDCVNLYVRLAYITERLRRLDINQ